MVPSAEEKTTVVEEYSGLVDTDPSRPSNPMSMDEPKIKEFYSNSDRIARKDNSGLASRLSKEKTDGISVLAQKSSKI